MNEEVSQHTFNQGLLLAARAAGAPDCFVAEGPKWDAAFEAVYNHLKSDQSLVFSWWRWVHRDPIFGYYPAASELLLQGEHDLLLGLLGPSMDRAVFLTPPKKAAQELEENFQHLDWFRALGSKFAAALTAV